MVLVYSHRSDWAGLLQEAKALQTSLLQQDKARNERIDTLRRAGELLGPDPESIAQVRSCFLRDCPMMYFRKYRKIAELS